MSVRNFIKRIVKYLIHGVPVVEKVSANVVSIDTNLMLKGRVALVTGGTSGIGKAIALAFLKSGATVIITGRSRYRVTSAIEELKISSSNKNVYGVELDNSKIDLLDTKFNEIVELLKPAKLDILVNNAGIGGGDISNTSEEEFDNVLQTNLKGTFFLSRVVAKYMIANKIKGNILNIASSSSLRPAASAYTFSKWGIRGFTIGLAKTLAPYGITVNGLAPGPTATPMLHRDANDITFTKNPMGRFAMPEEIANMAVVLVSGIGKMIVGDIIYMTGGAGVITYDDIDYRI